MKATLTTGPLYKWNIESDAYIKINQGGTSSGKTYSILQVLLTKAIMSCIRVLIVGQDIPNLKQGALRDFNDRILVTDPWLNEYIESYNRTERVYKLKNGSVIEFKSFKDGQDARSGKREISFFNEINGIKRDVYDQIALRTTQEIYMDYNPSEEFWVHDEIMTDPRSQTFYSNFTHNPFCPDIIIRNLFELKKKDRELWRVYGLGITGKIAELIYDNWEIVPNMPDSFRQEGYGMDYGYSADPTTLVHCGLLNERDLYVDEKFYTYNMKTREMHEAMLALGVRKDLYIVGDSAEKRVIDDLSEYGWKIYGAKKGPNSVSYGINLVSDYSIKITANSVNTRKEAKRYKYKVDPATGRPTNEPVKAYDHAMDAIRYWSSENLYPTGHRQRVKVR